MNKKHLLFSFCALLCAGYSSADIIKVENFYHNGPYPIAMPIQFDSTDVQSKKFEIKDVITNHFAPSLKTANQIAVTGTAPGHDGSYALHRLSFNIENSTYTTAKLNISGLENHKAYLDGTPVAGELKLKPATHTISIDYIADGTPSDSLKVSLETDDAKFISLRNDGKRVLTLADIMHGKRISSTSTSPDGKWAIVVYYNSLKGGQADWSAKLYSTADGRVVGNPSYAARWMPKSNKYYYTRRTAEGIELVTVDPATGNETVMAEKIPSGQFTMSPDESYLIYTTYKSGPAEDLNGVYQILTPNDRQPGWRNRSSLAKYDLSTGFMSPITFGHHNTMLSDISPDATKLLVMTSYDRLTERPTTLFSLYLVDLASMKAEALVTDDGFIQSAQFSPDGTKILITGSPEALGSIGKNVPEGRTPSMYDIQLYSMNLADKKITPLTKNFNPSISSVAWNNADNRIYFTADNRDMISFYRLNPADGKITQIDMPEDLVKGFSLPSTGNTMTWIGQGASAPDAFYVMNTKNLKSTEIDRPLSQQIADVELGRCEAWNFVNERGDTIYGRYYLPANFDETKKYPLIVNYYGGCTPTARNFESRYPHHVYAANGYVVYVIEPSGAAGFGQEFSSRHVNTAGKGVADDIIEGTKKFCAQHPYVNDKKIGCIGASYGGFMTQYLQTVTDIFAAAISHAGISDHTSYWGEGYWGFSYSETSMANSYPWSDQELYVKQSPLYNADKINTPLLFLHGDKDNNVPVGESIQMFTALKLLGKETAFVAVANQDHHILDYDKRIKWQDTIFAWFAKWLQDNPKWWDEMYPEKSL